MRKYVAFAVIVLYLGLGSCDDGEESYEIGDDVDAAPPAVIPSTGFYVVNEGWFGTDNGTVNYFRKDDNIAYRVYSTANEGERLGITTQFATIYGKYAYFISKQGNKLVVADAGTLKKKAVFTDLGGDGRSFLGIDDRQGYIGMGINEGSGSTGHGLSIRRFDIENLKLGAPIEGVTEEIGTMCYAEGRVFAVSANKLYIIRIETGSVEKTLNGSFHTLARSKDGMIWVAASDNFIKIDPITLEQENVAYPAGAPVPSSWGSWNAGSLCASTQHNVLYWINGKNLIKYDLDSGKINPRLYTLGGDDEGMQMMFYGAALRVDPISDELVMTVVRDGDYSYNKVYVANADGKVQKRITVRGSNESDDERYYWFPAMPFFEDPNSPEILIEQIRLVPGQTKNLNLNEKIVDADNTSVSILKSVEFVANDLVTAELKGGTLTVSAKKQLGSTQCKMTAISNGKRVEKLIQVEVIAN